MRVERIFDIIFSAFALLFLFPLLVTTALILAATGEREVFFLQERIGRKGKKFKLIKFATMLKNSPSIGTGTVTLREDPRILPVGKFLRKTKINELPQLLNILIGDMSIIGPRPLTDETFAAYSAETQSLIRKVRPGLSGVGSVVFRDEEKILSEENANIDFYLNRIAPYKGKLEEWFVERKSLYIYFSFIFLTCWAVLLPNSKAIWYWFRDLPQPPKELRLLLNYPN